MNFEFGAKFGETRAPEVSTLPEHAVERVASQYIANAMLLVPSTACMPLFVRALRVSHTILMRITAGDV